MPNTVNYGSSAYAELGTLLYSGDFGPGTPGSVTATTLDGSIVPDDEVTITGFRASNVSDAQISGGDCYYYGTQVFNGETGYIFGEASTYGAATHVLVLFSDPSAGGDGLTAAAIRDWSVDGARPAPTNGEALCFGPGTMIAAPDGVTAVEDLQIGDLVLTAGGEAVPVTWIGRQTAPRVFAGPSMQPVRIRAGALGDGLPHSDLTVTADHGMIVDGLVINASALVNGSTIDWVPMHELPDEVTYYHIETEDHDVILANGAPAETFIDYAGRQAFDNYGEYVALYGAERIIPEMDRPRISARRLVPDAIKARLGIVEPEIDWDVPLSA